MPPGRWLRTVVVVRDERRASDEQHTRGRRHGHHRRRPVRLGSRLLPGAAGPIVRHPRRERARRRRVAQALGLTLAVHARALRRPAGHAVPGERAPTFISKDADGRLSRGVRRALRSSRSHRRAGRPLEPTRRPLRSWRPASTIFEADNVVVAMANYQQPRRPAFAGELDPRIVQLHSNEYRNPVAAANRVRVLVVGVGNSGADIAMEVAETHPTLLAGKEDRSHPVPDRAVRRAALSRQQRAVRRPSRVDACGPASAARSARGSSRDRAPLIRVKPKDLERGAGSSGSSGSQEYATGFPSPRTIECSRSTTSSGAPDFAPGFSWIDLPILGDRQEPMHERGVVEQRTRPVLRRARLPVRSHFRHDHWRAARRRGGSRST